MNSESLDGAGSERQARFDALHGPIFPRGIVMPDGKLLGIPGGIADGAVEVGTGG